MQRSLMHVIGRAAAGEVTKADVQDRDAERHEVSARRSAQLSAPEKRGGDRQGERCGEVESGQGVGSAGRIGCGQH